MKQNVYQMVTDRIIKKMEEGVIPWDKPWIGADEAFVNYVSRKSYSLLNQCLLEEAGEYLTFNQCKELCGSIKKGAKAKFVVFYKMVEDKKVTVKNEKGEDEHPTYPVLKYYNVFHINDCEGIESKFEKKQMRDFNPIEKAEEVIASYLEREPHLTFECKESGRAFYRPSEDKVVVPLKEQFTSDEAYYEVSFHELTHSTATKDRCDRMLGEHAIAAFDEDYSREELVAEFGSAMLCNHCGIETTIERSAAYIQNWLKALRNDNKMIVLAASKAEKAAKYIIGEKEQLVTI